MSNYDDFNNYNNQTDGKHYINNNYNYRDSYEDSEIVGIGTWIFVLIATAIPFVNIIALFILAFGVKNQNLKNYGKGALIVIGIFILLGVMVRGCTSVTYVQL